MLIKLQDKVSYDKFMLYAYKVLLVYKQTLHNFNKLTELYNSNPIINDIINNYSVYPDNIENKICMISTILANKNYSNLYNNLDRKEYIENNYKQHKIGKYHHYEYLN